MQSNTMDTSCLIQVYSDENKDLWKDTKYILSLLPVDHESILPCLWSASGN